MLKLVWKYGTHSSILFICNTFCRDFLLPTDLVIVFVHWVSIGVLYEPRQCSLFWDYIPESKLFLPQSVPPARYIFNPTNTEVAQLSTTWRYAVGPASGIHPDGEQPKTALWLWVREITWYLFTRGVRGRMKAKQRWFKVTRELCHEWFHHSWRPLDWKIRHSHLASTLFHSLVPWWRPRRIRPQITRLGQLENSAMGTWPIYKNFIIRDWLKKWRDIKFWYMC